MSSNGMAFIPRIPSPPSHVPLTRHRAPSHFDPATNRLYTARLHLKRSKIPSAIISLLPKSLVGAAAAGPGGNTQSYILERSVVDMATGVMLTESRNLEFTGILRVVERQLYRRPSVDAARYFRDAVPHPRFRLQPPTLTGARATCRPGERRDNETTAVNTKIELLSTLGQAPGRLFRRKSGVEDDDAPQKVGFFRSLSMGSIQRSIEAVGLRRAERAVPKSVDGMNVVLQRLRNGGLVAVLEGMRRDAMPDAF